VYINHTNFDGNRSVSLGSITCGLTGMNEILGVFLFFGSHHQERVNTVWKEPEVLEGRKLHGVKSKEAWSLTLKEWIWMKECVSELLDASRVLE